MGPVGRRQWATSALACVLALAAGCAGASGGPAPAKSSAPSGAQGQSPGQGGATTATPPKSAAALASKWDGLTPLPPPPAPPAVKPVQTGGATPPVVSRIPTPEKVVFLTFDDGMTKDPAFIQFVADYRLPITTFLTNNDIKDDYGYFRKLAAAGAAVEDHTLTHPDFHKLGAAGQRQEICGQADILTQQYGSRPDLFRPPYGNLGKDTPAVAKACGMKAIMLWTATMPGHALRYQQGDRLRPGDIILLHFRPKLVFDLIILLKEVRRQGFTVARLTDYV